MKPLIPADLSEKTKVRVNGKALTALTQAFEAGFRTALRGASCQANYKSPIFVEAYERGYRNAKQKMEKSK